jgi:hypothetical protein
MIFLLQIRLYLDADTLMDREGNYYTNDFTIVTTSENPDTVSPKIYKTIPSSGTRDADYQNQEFYFFFDDAFNRNAAKTGIRLQIRQEEK